MARLSYVNDDNFDAEVAATDELVLLDFTADWCEPCKAMEPTLEDLAAEFAGRLRVIKVDLDESPEVTRKMRVMSIPTLIMLRDGEAVKRLRGPQTKDQLTTEVIEALTG